jgi:hypothetical protein
LGVFGLLGFTEKEKKRQTDRQDVASDGCWEGEGVELGEVVGVWYVALEGLTDSIDQWLTASLCTGSAGIAELAIFHPVRSPDDCASGAAE